MTIETKFNIGDEVWFLDTIRRKARKEKIIAFTVDLKAVKLLYGVFSFENIFKTKEELIESLFN